MTLTSSAFENNKNIPSKYTCDGENINPPLGISGVDEKARSLVLIMEDPDVPKFVREDGRWNHWLKFNLPVSVTEIKEGLEPEGLSGITTSNTLKYQGPCPPDREHRYFFKLYSLDTILSLKEGVTKETIEQAMENHILQKAVLMGLYNRKR
ncbi:YbhB/YbcL family Raf kinase inhibitor-like protein [Candidatus Azambacteria bacterium]|nr:YbhB/YbcL family Raf kinase inhibitor-like protein [Candidatus Azambacteria bacterium]